MDLGGITLVGRIEKREKVELDSFDVEGVKIVAEVGVLTREDYSLGKDFYAEDPPGRISYVQRQANTYNSLKVGSGKGFENGKYCGQYAKIGECEDNHQYLKVIFCGKDWCENCRDLTHKRRQARLMPKVATMEKGGYFIFTVPEEMRDFYQVKENLSELRTYLRRKLKRIFPDLRAITRWHWFGEKDLLKYHPHLNILVDSLQRIDKETLDKIKSDYKRGLERFTGTRLEKKVNVYYQFLTTKERIYHKLNYITRPTFLVYQKDLAMRLKGYRNSSTWGKFRELTLDELERLAIQREGNSKTKKEVILLSNNICPCCGKKIKWRREIYPGSLSFMGEDLGEGYSKLRLKLPRGSPLFEFPKDQLEMELLIGPVEDHLAIRRKFTELFEEDRSDSGWEVD